MDQSLNYVRVNCKLFDTVLCNALEQSLRNIRQTRGHKDVNNEIVLSFREQPRETKVARFTDTRLMVLTVIDTSRLEGVVRPSEYEETSFPSYLPRGEKGSGGGGRQGAEG